MFTLIGQRLPYARVDLRNPSFGDTEVNDTNLRFERTRQGEPKAVKADSWPNIETRQYVFEVLTRSEINNLIDFLTETAAEPVFMNDYNDEVSIVLITNTEYIITTARDECNYNVPLDVLILESNIPSTSVSPVPEPSVIEEAAGEPAPGEPVPGAPAPEPEPSVVAIPIISPSPSII